VKTSSNKALSYLREHEGEAVSPEEMLAAGVSRTMGTLRSTMSRLIRDPRNGVHYVGDKRRHGSHRSYRYLRVPWPADPVRITVQVIGTTTEGHRLACSESGEIFELRRIGEAAP
jgi:hypothetical protein